VVTDAKVPPGLKMTFTCAGCGKSNNFTAALHGSAAGHLACGQCGQVTVVALPDLKKEMAKRERNRGFTIIGGVLVLAMFVYIAFIMEPKTDTGTPPSDPLAQMEIAFQGNPSQATIKEKLDRALELYQTPRTNDSYSRAGSTLVTLHQNLGFTEMEILDQMICMNLNAALPPDNAGINFPDGAGLAASALNVNDRCAP